MPLICAFTVLGAAKPQGSTKTITRPVHLPDGRTVYKPVITHSNRASLMQWRQDIRTAVQIHAPQLQHELVRGPVAVVAIFHRTRPASISKKKQFPVTAPDLDKLQRAVGDALEKTVLVNDAQIKGWIAWELFTDGAARLELQIWTPDHPMMPAADMNPFHQPGLFG